MNKVVTSPRETTVINHKKNTMENQIILYQTELGNVTVDVVFRDESFWLTQKAMSKLFDVEIPAISKHLKNIFESGELEENSVISKMETTATDGKNYLTLFYNLDAIIAVPHAGKISHEQAISKAEQEYENFRIEQDKHYISNFDEILENLEQSSSA